MRRSRREGSDHPSSEHKENYKMGTTRDAVPEPAKKVKELHKIILEIDSEIACVCFLISAVLRWWVAVTLEDGPLLFTTGVRSDLF